MAGTPAAKKPVSTVKPTAAAAPLALITPDAPAKPQPAKPARLPAARPAPKTAAKPAAPTPPAAPQPAPTKETDMTETVKNVAEKAQAQTKTMIDDAQGRAKDTMARSQKLFAESNDFAKGNIEALIESSKIAARGAEEIAKYSADYARETVAKANENARRFASVKSPTELFQLQSELARNTVDAFAAESAKFTENYLKLVGEVVQPLSNRFALAAEKAKLAA